jgi:protein-L-isoaspartate(D-aspartate) O-methyltransferase
MVQWSPYIDWSKRLESEGYLKTPRLIQAFKTVKRSDFLPAGQEHFASTNSPVPIGYRQTNSQPSVVAEMLEWLEPKTGQRVLDIGSGSGWTTALLADVVGYKGHVLGLEKVPELVKWSRTNIKKYDYKQVEIREAGAKLGAPRSERFDSILVSAVGEMDWAADLSKQLTDSGRLVMPIFLDERTELDPSLRSQGILVMQKHGTKEPEFEIHPDFVFVPLIY